MDQNKKLLYGTIAVTALIFVGLVWAILSAPPSDPGPGPSVNGELAFNDANDPALGPENAKVVVRLFGDLQCPACRAAEPGVQYAIDTYSDRVRFVWNDFPLQSIHPNARIAANAARCAEGQGKFWEYKDLLYLQQNSWANSRNPQEAFRAYAGQLELNTDQFASCLSSRTHDAKVLADITEANRNGVDRTPTVFINNDRRFGLSPQEWDSLLTAALNAAGEDEQPAADESDAGSATGTEAE